MERAGSPTFNRSRAPSPIPLLEVHMEQIADLSLEQQDIKNIEYNSITANILTSLTRAVQSVPKNTAV